ncbi:MAG: adenylate kinase [Acidobacteria bacterium]|nr:adenylate kinase [Acidobacteriota bacterium]
MATARVSTTTYPFAQPSGAIILFGPPGAGKGTQAEKIADRYGVSKISTGDMIRQEIRSGSDLGQDVEARLAAGQLIDDATVNRLVEARLEVEDCKGGFLLDGYPRTGPQAGAFAKVLERKGCGLVVIEVRVGYNEIVKRITGRRLCSQCGAIYNVHSQPPKVSEVCDVCGHRPLGIRSDDREEVVKERLRLYEAETMPVFEVFRAAGRTIHQVDGASSAEEVSERIFGILEAERSHDYSKESV